MYIQQALKNKFSLKKLFIYSLCSPFFAVSFVFLYKQSPHLNKHLLIYNKGNEKSNYLINQLGSIDYRPTFYLPTCIIQMIYNEIKYKIHLEFRRENIITDDGGLISLEWAENYDKPQNTNKQTRLIVILHGLTGGSESSYIRDIVKEFMDNESNKVVVVQYRGINNSPLLTPRSFHAGDTTDIAFAMKYLKNKFPDFACYTIGTSMGGNIFVKLFAHDHSFDQYVKGFISVSNPFNFSALEKRNRGTIIDYFLSRRQKNYVKTHYKILKTRIGN